MDYRSKIKGVVIISLISISGIFTFFLISAVNDYTNSAKGAEAFRKDVKIEMITIEVNDGASVNALFMCSHDNWQKSDRSVPFVVACHGLSSGPFQMLDAAYTFANRGFAVLIPEDRGHESSSETFTFGSKEPWDIISLMDYVEENEEYNCVDTYNSGIIGESLGGLMGMSTYIFESQGKQRLKAAALGAGPLNLTRAIEWYTSTPEALGETAFMGNLTGEIGDKNPINYVDETFPSNVLLRHGTEDKTVDFRCSQDFYRKINPNGDRIDVRLDIKEGAGHEVAGNKETLKHMVSWIENYTIHANKASFTEVKEVNILRFKDFSSSDAFSFISNLQFACVLLIFLIPLSIYLIKPEIYETKRDKEIQVILQSDAEQKAFRKPPRSEKLMVLGGFIGIQVIVSLVAFFLIQEDVLTEVLLPAVFSMAYVLYLYYKKFPEDVKEWCKQSFNPKAGSIFIISALVSMTIYHLIPNIPLLEQSMLFFGVRVIWLFPYVIAMFTLSFMSNVFLSRYLLSGAKFSKIRLIEPFLNGLLVLSSVLIMLFWNLNGVINIPQFGNDGLPLVIIIAFLLAFIYILMDFIAQITELTFKTMVIIPIMLSLIAALLSLSNYDIFYFF